jgi:DHA1 family tetracycline resistance protein-like MFS transporter
MNQNTLPTEAQKIQKKIMISIFFTLFLDLIGFGLFLPLLSHVARSFSASDSQVALLSSCFALASFFSGVLVGYFCDLFGRKKLIVLTLCLSCVAQGLTAFTSSYAFLVFTRILAGIGSGNMAAAQACLSDITSQKERGRYMVIIGLAFGGGFAVGPALGALVLWALDSEGSGDFQENNSLKVLSLIAVFFNVVNIFLVLKNLPETHFKFMSAPLRALFGQKDQKDPFSKSDAKHPFSGFLKNNVFFWIVLLLFLQVLAFTGVETLLPLILKDAYFFSQKEIYKTYIFIGVMTLFANGVMAKEFLKRCSEKQTLQTGHILLSLGFCCLPFFSPHPFLLFVGLFVLCLGVGISNPALNTLISFCTPAEKQGMAFGLAQAISSLARIVGPTFMGVAYQTGLGFESVMKEKSLYLSACLLFTGWALGFFKFKKL